MMRKLINFCLIPFLLSACTLDPDGTVTVVLDLETDTFISTASNADHSELDYLSVLKAGARENRILVKFPTGSRDEEGNLDLCLTHPLCFVYFMPIYIIRALLSPNCADTSFTAANLNWAYLQFVTIDGSTVPAGTLQAQLLSQPWWHAANWSRAHPFSNQGIWATAGGAIDTGVTFEPNCTNLQGGQTCAAGEIKFDMTDYFKNLIGDSDPTHFGLVISAPVDRAEVRVHSVQGSLGDTPIIVANYNCISTSQAETHVFPLQQLR